MLWLKSKAYKMFCGNLESPYFENGLQWDGSVSFHLPKRCVHLLPVECGFGWNACESLHDLMQVNNLFIWRQAKDFISPVRVFELKKPHWWTIAIKVGNKVRSSSWIVVRELTEKEIENWFTDEFSVNACYLIDKRRAAREIDRMGAVNG